MNKTEPLLDVQAASLKQHGGYGLSICADVVKQALEQGFLADLERQERRIKQERAKLDQAREAILKAFYKDFGRWSYVRKEHKNLNAEEVAAAVEALGEFLGFESKP